MALFQYCFRAAKVGPEGVDLHSTSVSPETRSLRSAVGSHELRGQITANSLTHITSTRHTSLAKLKFVWRLIPNSARNAMLAFARTLLSYTDAGYQKDVALAYCCTNIQKLTLLAPDSLRADGWLAFLALLREVPEWWRQPGGCPVHMLSHTCPLKSPLTRSLSTQAHAVAHAGLLSTALPCRCLSISKTAFAARITHGPAKRRLACWCGGCSDDRTKLGHTKPCVLDCLLAESVAAEFARQRVRPRRLT